MNIISEKKESQLVKVGDISYGKSFHYACKIYRKTKANLLDWSVGITFDAISSVILSNDTMVELVRTDSSDNMVKFKDVGDGVVFKNAYRYYVKINCHTPYDKTRIEYEALDLSTNRTIYFERDTLVEVIEHQLVIRTNE
jgi:hypothetical protein